MATLHDDYAHDWYKDGYMARVEKAPFNATKPLEWQEGWLDACDDMDYEDSLEDDDETL